MLDPDENLPPVSAPLVDPAELRSWVLFEDERLLVLDKPGWLVVHPSKRGPWSSLAGAVREGLGLQTIRLVYRLDRETSGVVVLAKDEATGRRLQKAVAGRLIGKAYGAIVEGEMREPQAVALPLGPDLRSEVTVRQRVVEAGTAGAQAAQTVFTPLAVAGGFTLAGVQLLTGRKHQIRAHAEAVGHRVVGDKLYGPDAALYLEFAREGWTPRHSALLPMTRQALHCAAIDLRPAGMDYRLRAPWPADLARFAERRMGLSAATVQGLMDGFVAELMPGGEAPISNLQASENDQAAKQPKFGG
ncbi:MAG: RluA family pseudouridine synthase [Opitutae bacterium]|nr:RluA family pseudouridine synthase [Opitutae bacterium]